MSTDESGNVRIRLIVSAIIGIVVSTGLVWYVSGGPFFEVLPRIIPTVEGGGVGADWSTGHAAPLYTWLIWVTKAAVALAGLTILYMVLMHWMAFHRLADRMQQPAGASSGSESDATTDGGRPVDDGGDAA
ncbi:hypothetical protein ACERIT_13690 [Halopenitus sp. H-Gu1]|uniref:hypothetical protein n=1 Tax=Halopenitus sp. H-Gu1 TaxID=3242697 RepID=UPI00359CFC71